MKIMYATDVKTKSTFFIYMTVIGKVITSEYRLSGVLLVISALLCLYGM
jgi:hypothetical protein